MQEFFDYKYLSTLTGITAATVLIVQFIKDIKLIKKIKTRWLVLTVSFIMVTTISCVTGKFALNDVPLYIVNSLLVTSMSIGSWHTFSSKGKNDISK